MSFKKHLFFLSLMLFGLVFTKPGFTQSAFEDPGSRGISGGNGLIPVEAEIDGGTISIGSTAQVVVLFRNEGSRPVQTGAINLYPSSNVSPTITLNQCAQEPLQAGAECAVAISLKGLQAGPWRVEMLMRHDGRTRLVTTTLSGAVESSGEGAQQLISDIETIPSELEYGTLSASRAQLKSVTLRNVTSTPVSVDNVFLKANDASGLSLESDCGTLQSGQACVVSVLWSPKQRGPTSGVIVVKHSGPTGIATVDVIGEFSPKSSSEAEIFPEAVPGRGLMISSLGSVDYGSDVDTLAAITTSLVNDGDAPLTIEDISLSGKDNGLKIESAGCQQGTTLEPLEACPLTITWGPVRSGTILDDVKVEHTGARGVLVLPIRGTAEEIVDRNSQSIVLSKDSPGFSLDAAAIDASELENLSTSEQETAGDTRSEANRQVPVEQSARASNYNDRFVGDKAQVLDGYKITSLASDRAIITSPRGSRVIFDRETMVVGGVEWVPLIQYNSVEFQSGRDKVLMLFDRSLSSFNSSSSQSDRSGSDTSDEE